jgi:hypothetical protein
MLFWFLWFNSAVHLCEDKYAGITLKIGPFWGSGVEVYRISDEHGASMYVAGIGNAFLWNVRMLLQDHTA